MTFWYLIIKKTIFSRTDFYICFYNLNYMIVLGMYSQINHFCVIIIWSSAMKANCVQVAPMWNAGKTQRMRKHGEWGEWCVGIAGLRCWLHRNMYVFIIPPAYRERKREGCRDAVVWNGRERDVLLEYFVAQYRSWLRRSAQRYVNHEIARIAGDPVAESLGASIFFAFS